MRFQITHRTTYVYSQPVHLEQHTLRFKPRSDGSQFLESFRLRVQPVQAGTTAVLDAEGNTTLFAWFDGLYEQLEIVAQSTVVTLRQNPFDFLLDTQKTALPIHYEEASLLAATRIREAVPDGEDPVGRFAGDVAGACGFQAVRFLSELNRRIHRNFAPLHRSEGDPLPAWDTLDKQAGACRDLAVLFMDACRSQGLAARFVSGYQEPIIGNDNQELHAWAEVYIPGAGWRGYDPTQGLAVTDRHVAVAASAHPANAIPVTGTFRGTRAVSTMTAEIQVRLQDASAQVAT